MTTQRSVRSSKRLPSRRIKRSVARAGYATSYNGSGSSADSVARSWLGYHGGSPFTLANSTFGQFTARRELPFAARMEGVALLARETIRAIRRVASPLVAIVAALSIVGVAAGPA